MSAHPSELFWTRMLDGALGPLERLSLFVHLRRCERCRAERDAMLAERAAFEGSSARESDLQAIAGRVPRTSSPPRAGGRWAKVGFGLAAAAAVLVAVVVTRPATDDALRPKGGELFELVVKRGEVVAPLGRTCREGDAVRARFRSDRRELLVVGIDPSGKVAALHPFGGTTSAAVPGGEGLTPGSWVLDRAPGRERFVAIFSDSPVSLEAARAAAARASGGRLEIPGATVLEGSCEKEAP